MIKCIIGFMILLIVVLIFLWRNTVLKLTSARRLIAVARNRNYELWMENKKLSSEVESKQEELKALQKSANDGSETIGISIH